MKCLMKSASPAGVLAPSRPPLDAADGDPPARISSCPPPGRRNAREGDIGGIDRRPIRLPPAPRARPPAPRARPPAPASARQRPPAPASARQRLARARQRPPALAGRRWRPGTSRPAPAGEAPACKPASAPQCPASATTRPAYGLSRSRMDRDTLAPSCPLSGPLSASQGHTIYGRRAAARPTRYSVT